MLCDFTEREHLEACVHFPLDFRPSTFPFADFVLYHSTVIKHSCGNDYMLSTVSPPSESVNLRDTPDTSIIKALKNLPRQTIFWLMKNSG